MNKNIRLLGITVIVLLAIINILQFNTIRDLKNSKSNDKKRLVQGTTMYIPKDYVLPVLLEEEIDITKLYDTSGYLLSAHHYIQISLGNEYPDILDYLGTTKIEIEKLINLMETNKTDKEINEQVQHLINLQVQMIEKYYGEFDLQSYSEMIKIDN